MIYLGFAILFLLYDVWNQLQKDEIYNERFEDLEIQQEDSLLEKKMLQEKLFYIIQENSVLRERLSKANIDTAHIACYTRLFSENESKGSMTEDEDSIIK